MYAAYHHACKPLQPPVSVLSPCTGHTKPDQTQLKHAHYLRRPYADLVSALPGTALLTTAC